MKDKPVLVIRGAVSDILDEEVLDEMERRKPDMQRPLCPSAATVPRSMNPRRLRRLTLSLRAIRTGTTRTARSQTC